MGLIREVSLRDIPECVGVIRRSFMTVAEEFGFTEENAPRFTAFAADEGRLWYQLEREKRPMYAYIDAEGRIGGYYSLMLMDNTFCELNNLCVLPELRHAGVGAELLRDSFSRAEKAGCTLMKIGIVEENAPLRRWYESMGFIHTGTEKFDFFPFTCGYLEKNLG